MVVKMSDRKQPPDEKQLAFINVARKIYARIVVSEGEISVLSKAFQDTAKGLQVAINEGGQDGFWNVWDAYTIDHPRFSDWRQSIMVEPEETSEPEFEDERLTRGKSGKVIFRTLSMRAIKQLPRVQWQVPGVYQKVSVSMTYGDANTGKTFVDLDIALHLAYGMCWQGRKLAQTRVLYIYGEGNEGLANRIDAWQRKHGKEDTDAIQFICFPVQLMTEMEILCATIEEQETIPGLIVLDTFSVCAEGVPENDNVEVARFISCASKIKRTYKTHVHIIHHAGKNGDYRGAAAFKGNVDTMALLCREDNEAPIIMVCKKQKDAFYFPDIRLQLEQVILGFDEETLESISSCVVVSSDELTFNEERVNQERQVMMNALAKSEKMSVKMWREACARENVSRNAFYAHKDYLVQTGRIVEEKLGPGKPVYYSAIKDEG